MAYIIPNISPPLLQSKDKSPLLLHQTSAAAPPPPSTSPYLALTKLDLPPARVAQVNRSPGAQDNKHDQRDDFYINVGLAVRTLREDLPLLFSKDLNYDIYRDDITFVDPLNTFTGIEKYKLIFWALRFHGKILFKEISLEVFRIWQPSQNVIVIRWNLRGVPRVPWEAKGQFQGTSTYKLDRNGKIYEHKVDNLSLNFPQALKPAASMLDLVTVCPASPNPTFSWSPLDLYSSPLSLLSSSSSWVKFYRAVRETLDHEVPLSAQDCLLTFS